MAGSQRGASGNQSDTAGDQENAGPSPGTDSFMEKKAREKCRDYVTECAGRKNEGEIGPGERGEVRIKKAGEEGDAQNDPGIDKSAEDVGPVGEMDFPEVVHAALQQDIARAVAAGDGHIDKNFLEFHADIRLEPAWWRASPWNFT